MLRPTTPLWPRLAQRLAAETGGEPVAPAPTGWSEPGTVDHRVWSETGCTCLLVTSPRDVLR